MTWTWTPLLFWLAIVWGVFTVGLIILLIYRSTLTMHEDEQLYLDDANSHMQQEQTELLVKGNRLTKPVWVFGAGALQAVACPERDDGSSSAELCPINGVFSAPGDPVEKPRRENRDLFV